MPLPRTLALLEHQMSTGLHVGYQLYVSLDATPLLDHAAGLARPDGVPLTPDSLMLWMSAGKPVTAVAVAQLWEKNLLDLDDPVARHVPEFAAHGKDRITLRHCLTHTAGFRGPINNFTTGTWDEIVARVCALRPEPHWTPGRKAGYHAASSWFILGEVVQRASRTPFPVYVRDHIFLPAGMTDSWIGMSAEQYRAYGDRLALLPHTHTHPPTWDTPANAEPSTTLPRPGANARGPMRELGRLYETLLDKGGPILSAQATEAITAPHRVGMVDLSFQHKIDWALGFYVNSNHYADPDTPYGYGPHASVRTFGHSGNQSSVAFADPEHKLVVALAFNGLPGEPLHQDRTTAVLTTLYEELGLTRHS